MIQFVVMSQFHIQLQIWFMIQFQSQLLIWFVIQFVILSHDVPQFVASCPLCFFLCRIPPWGGPQLEFFYFRGGYPLGGVFDHHFSFWGVTPLGGGLRPLFFSSGGYPGGNPQNKK